MAVDRKALLESVFEAQTSACPRCRYDLTGHRFAEGDLPRCPECGIELLVSVRIYGAGSPSKEFKTLDRVLTVGVLIFLGVLALAMVAWVVF